MMWHLERKTQRLRWLLTVEKWKGRLSGKTVCEEGNGKESDGEGLGSKRKGNVQRKRRNGSKRWKQSIWEFSQLRILLMNSNSRKRINRQFVCMWSWSVCEQPMVNVRHDDETIAR
jgi:hypothetical protein